MNCPGQIEELFKIITFFSHPHFEAFFEPTMLTLVSMMLVNGAISASSTLVGKASSDGPFKEAFAS